MKRGGSPQARAEEVALWIETGVREYAELCGSRGPKLVAATTIDVRKFEGENLSREQVAKLAYKGDIHQNIRMQVERYGKLFGRVLRVQVGISDDVLGLCAEPIESTIRSARHATLEAGARRRIQYAPGPIAHASSAGGDPVLRERGRDPRARSRFRVQNKNGVLGTRRNETSQLSNISRKTPTARSGTIASQKEN